MPCEAMTHSSRSAKITWLKDGVPLEETKESNARIAVDEENTLQIKGISNQGFATRSNSSLVLISGSLPPLSFFFRATKKPQSFSFCVFFSLLSCLEHNQPIPPLSSVFSLSLSISLSSLSLSFLSPCFYCAFNYWPTEGKRSKWESGRMFLLLSRLFYCRRKRESPISRTINFVSFFRPGKCFLWAFKLQ